MNSTESPVVTITVPADVRYFRSVRLAIGGLATLVGFDIEAIDDLRIGVDEVCAALVEAGDGADLRLEICAEPGHRGCASRAPSPRARWSSTRTASPSRARSSRSCPTTTGTPRMTTRSRCWLERALVSDDDAVDAGRPVSTSRRGTDGDPAELTARFQEYREDQRPAAPQRPGRRHAVAGRGLRPPLRQPRRAARRPRAGGHARAW